MAEDFDAAILQAQTQRKGGDLQAAAHTLSQLVLFEPDNPLVLAEYGKVLVAQGRSDDALAFLERAIQLKPRDWSLYSAQGVAYDQKSDYRSAQVSYARALALEPNEPAVLNNAALSYMQAGNLEGAESLLLRIAPGANDYPRIAQNLAMVRDLQMKRGENGAVLASTPKTLRLMPVPVVLTPHIAAAPLRLPELLPAVVASKAPASTQSAVVTEILSPRVKKVDAPKTESMGKSAPERKHLVLIAEQKPALKSSAYYVQAGAFGSEERAGAIAESLDRLGARVSPASVGGHPVYRVRIGPFLDTDQANMAAGEAKRMGHGDLKIVSE